MPEFAWQRLFDQRDAAKDERRRYRLAWLSARRRANRGWLNYHAAEGALLYHLDAPRELSESGSELTRENADLLMSMWHRMEFGHPHKDGMRQAATILYNLAAASGSRESDADA